MKSPFLLVKAENNRHFCLDAKKGDMMILAGDIGGTHTRLALFENGKQLLEEKFPSRDYTGLEKIVVEFMKTQSNKIERACFGIAGPVRDGKCRATNLPWVVDAAVISKGSNIPSVTLINDLEANAYGLKVLKEDEFFILHPGTPGQKGNQALIAAGTGLGEAGLYWDGKDHHPFACEGGHTDFAPRDSMEMELLVYLKGKYGRVSYERVISGPGLLEIYKFLIETKRVTRSSEIEEEMKNKDPSSVVSDWGMKNKDLGCVKAVDWFISLYGAEAGNLALKFLSLGGLYIGGGIAPVLLDKMKKGAFLSSFIDKGRFKELLSTIPIKVVLNDNAALLGAAYHAAQK